MVTRAVSRRLKEYGSGFAELLDGIREVVEVPGFEDFAVAQVHEAGAGEGDGFVGCGKAEAFAGVGDGGGPAAGDVVALDELFVDGDADAGEGLLKSR
jgi:hypothetical protein